MEYNDDAFIKIDKSSTESSFILDNERTRSEKSIKMVNSCYKMSETFLSSISSRDDLTSPIKIIDPNLSAYESKVKRKKSFFSFLNLCGN